MLNYQQYIEDLRKAYVGRVVTITGGHSQAGRTGRVARIESGIAGEAITIDLFGPPEPQQAVVRRMDHLRLEPIPG